MKISSHFAKLGFHDAGINKIVRDSGVIEIEMEYVTLGCNHPQYEGETKILERCVLKFFEVTSEKALFYDGNQTKQEHPEPEFPLDEILTSEHENGVYRFSGFKNRAPWYIWLIEAQNFELSIS